MANNEFETVIVSYFNLGALPIFYTFEVSNFLFNQNGLSGRIFVYIFISKGPFFGRSKLMTFMCF